MAARAVKRSCYRQKFIFTSFFAYYMYSQIYDSVEQHVKQSWQLGEVHSE